MNNKAPTVQLQGKNWIQALRRHTRATDRRTLITSCVPDKPLGDNSIVVGNEGGPVAVASALLTANMNSLPLDWAARGSVGGMNLGFFIVRQLPILPPETYLETACVSRNFAELVAERVLELTYTAHDLEPFARALGYEGFPFVWNEERRHGLQSELDAIYAHMYRLDREDLKWILDPLPPSISFSTLKKNEEQEFGEYRTQRLVLQAYDQLAAGAEPDVSGEAG